MSKPVPLNRILTLNDESPNAGGEFVLYWMIANRRATWNFSLQRAAELAVQFQKRVRQAAQDLPAGAAVVDERSLAPVGRGRAAQD